MKQTILVNHKKIRIIYNSTFFKMSIVEVKDWITNKRFYFEVGNNHSILRKFDFEFFEFDTNDFYINEIKIYKNLRKLSNKNKNKKLKNKYIELFV
jgi:hypothetical protein